MAGANNNGERKSQMNERTNEQCEHEFRTSTYTHTHTQHVSGIISN